MKKSKINKSKKLYLLVAIIVIAIILIDQLTKNIILNTEEITIIPNILKLHVYQAHGGIYDETSKAMNILTNLIILFIIFGFIKSNNQFITKKTKILLSFALAGGISNIIDKIFRGEIVEFINFTNFPSFNIADICIAIGWISFVAIFAAFSGKELTNRRSKNNSEHS